MTTPVGTRIPVHAVWQEKVGPMLSLGMLTAAARAWDGGALNDRFDIRRPETATEVLASLRDGTGPAVLLCSNYLWSLDDNLALARRAKVLCPELLVVHGGPSTPKYEGDAAHFLTEHGDVADVLVRGEGELTLCRLLEALAPTAPQLDRDRLAPIGGLTFRDPATGDVVRTDEPERIADLDALPSPYLTGEFDHIEASAWPYALSIETNRGCPYGCTFCDWGSATLSRIRKFDIDRVVGEFRWAAQHGLTGIQICDANFGIIARDVEIAEGLAAVKREYGYPQGVGFTPPKNTTKHVTRILDTVLDSGLLISSAISLQTIDEDTLAAVERSNISIDGYLTLAADLRRRGQPLSGDLLIGMPAHTYDAYKADLQFFVDHEIMARTWIIKLLPNAPMNDPEYRARYEIETDERGIVVSTSALQPGDIDRMLRLRKAEILGHRYGIVRHVGRFLQWDLGIDTTQLLEHLLAVTEQTPQRFPLLTWVFEYFDLHPTVPVGWHAFYRELRQLLVEDFGLDPDRSDLETVLRLQVALMPAPERTFPHEVELPHDYVAYYRDATATLYTTGKASTPSRPLADHGPARFTVTGDPLGLCREGLHFDGDSRDLVFEGDFHIGNRTAHELDSPLLAVLPIFSGDWSAVDTAALAASIVADIPDELRAETTTTGTANRERRGIPVRVGATPAP